MNSQPDRLAIEYLNLDDVDADVVTYFPTICLLVVQEYDDSVTFHELVIRLIRCGVKWFMIWGPGARNVEDCIDLVAETMVPPQLDIVTSSHNDEPFDQVVTLLSKAAIDNESSPRRWCVTVDR